MTFGSNVFFIVDFLLPSALTGDSGSAFSFGLTASDGLSPVLTLDASGFIGQISYDIVKTYGEESVRAFVPPPLPPNPPVRLEAVQLRQRFFGPKDKKDQKSPVN